MSNTEGSTLLDTVINGTWLQRLPRWRGKLTCSFCGKSEHEVTNLVAGAHAYICDRCIDKCSAIIMAERQGQPPKP